MITFTAWMILLTASAADSAVSPQLYPEYYDTLDQAGVAAIQHAYDHSQFYEYGGMILQTTNGKFRVEVPGTDYRGDGVFIDSNTNDYPGYFIVASYHTHPCLPYSHYPHIFSDGDVGTDTNSGFIGYLGDLCSGAVLRFVPGVTKEDRCFGPFEEIGLLHCGSTGLKIGQIKLTRRPIQVETPGPKALKRGKLS